ncbi:hypothetical protein ACTWP5_28675, partial [Streptomyces sp. 4N509B]
VATGAAARTASTAARAATHAGRALDPMTHVARGTSAAFSALRVPDLTAHLAAINAIDATRLPDNAGYRLPDGTTIPPNPTLDDLPLGTATLRLDDSTILIPHNPAITTPGIIIDPLGNTRLLPDGTLTDQGGNVLPRSGTAGPHVTGPSPREPEFVGSEPSSMAEFSAAGRATNVEVRFGIGGGDAVDVSDAETGGADIARADEPGGMGADTNGSHAGSGDVPSDMGTGGPSATAEWFDGRGTPTPRPQTHGLGDNHPGFSMMAQNDPFYRNALNISPLDGHYDVVAHGDPHHTYMHAADGRRISPRELAQIIRNQADYAPGSPIRLLSCNTGHMNGTFARRLAQHLGVPVIAPDGYLYSTALGRMGIHGELRRVFPSQVPDLPGSFHRYHVDGTVEELERSEWAVE